jgi:hypothetical protein
MDRLNHSQLPRFVLDVESTEAWLVEIIRAQDQQQSRPARSPMDSELSFGSDWALSRLGGSDKSGMRQMLTDMVTAAQEIGVLSTPDGVRIEMESGDDGYRFLVVSDERWGLTLAGRDMFFAEDMPKTQGVLGLMSLLMSAVREGNSMLSALVNASSLILAQFSTDPVLVTRLADHDEAFVRAIAADNPVAPEDAKVLRALRDEGER